MFLCFTIAADEAAKLAAKRGALQFCLTFNPKILKQENKIGKQRHVGTIFAGISKIQSHP